MNRRWLVAAAAVLAVALLGTGVALSDDGDRGSASHKARRLEAAFLDRLARELGISPERLSAAMRSARVKTLEDAVRAGIITSDEAARLRERIASGGPRGFGFGPLKEWHRDRPGAVHRRWSALGPLLRDEEARSSMAAAFAKTLDMSVERLRAALRDGRDLDDLIAERNVTEAELGAAVAAAARPHLDRLVISGSIERADADDLLERIAHGAWIGRIARLAGVIGR